MKPKTFVQRSGFSVGVILGVLGNLEIEPAWLKGGLMVAAWIATLLIFQLTAPSQPAE